MHKQMNEQNIVLSCSTEPHPPPLRKSGQNSIIDAVSIPDAKISEIVPTSGFQDVKCIKYHEKRIITIDHNNI